MSVCLLSGKMVLSNMKGEEGGALSVSVNIRTLHNYQSRHIVTECLLAHFYWGGKALE